MEIPEVKKAEASMQHRKCTLWEKCTRKDFLSESFPCIPHANPGRKRTNRPGTAKTPIPSQGWAAGRAEEMTIFSSYRVCRPLLGE